MSSLMRINANIQARKARESLLNTNEKLLDHQNKLATGKRINSSAEDPAGYHLANSLKRRKKGLDMALNNVENADKILNIAEGGYENVMDLLQTIKEKATQAADYSLSSSQRKAIDVQVEALISEVDDTVNETVFNGKQLLDGTFEGKFHTGERANDELKVSLQNVDSNALSLDQIDLSTQHGASTAIQTTSEAINKMSSYIQDVGEYKVRLDSKSQSLQNNITNTEAVRSSIEDADFANQQMQVSKLKILQQTSVSSMTQANSSPQVVLSLFQGG